MKDFFDEEEIFKSYVRCERYEVAQEAAKATALRLIKMNKISLDEIAKVTELPLDVIKELKDMQMA